MLSFPPHLVREYAARFGLGAQHRVLDPFCGTGTVVVECKKLGIPSVGVEAHPMAHFAGQVKADWGPDPNGLVEHAASVADAASDLESQCLESQGIEDNPVFLTDRNGHGPLRTPPREAASLLLTRSISPLPLHKTLVLLDVLHRRHDARYGRHEALALARALVTSIGNLQFGPEVGVGPAKADAPVVASWLDGVRAMARDLTALRGLPPTPSEVIRGDSREIIRVLEPGSVDAVITSPPYPNEKDYTRTTRLESVLLGFVTTKADLRAVKQGMIRSNTRGVYAGDDDDAWVSTHAEIQRIADEIERRRLELGKTSGFERTYARVTRLYFGGMARHLAELRRVLKPGARLAYVVGDQASYLRVMIHTGRILADLGRSLGYEVVGIDLFRTRLATATREQLREEVVVFRWPGVTREA